MKVWQLICIVTVMTATIVTAIFQIAGMQPSGAPPRAIVEAEVGPPPLNAIAEAAFNPAPLNATTVEAKFRSVSRQAAAATFAALTPNALVAAAFRAAIPAAEASPEVTGTLSPGPVLAYADDSAEVPEQQTLHLLGDGRTPAVGSVAWAKRELPYVKYYVYSELPPPMKPADIVLRALSEVPLGTPLEEIKHAAEAFGLDDNFLKTVAKIESDFDPTQRTGSYIGLFQLSKYEFARYGSGDIRDARDNAIAAAYKFVTEAAYFENATHKKPTYSDLYLIHQQGWQGAAEHVSHPQWLAWKSMCATDEGMQKGERWCKRAIWGNTLPAVKREWKSVDRLTSAAFVTMWRDRVDELYARYADDTSAVAQAQH